MTLFITVFCAVITHPRQAKIKLSKNNKKDKKSPKGSKESEGNRWVGFFDFFPSKTNRKKSKNPAWSDRREWNTKLQLCRVPRQGNVKLNDYFLITSYWKQFYIIFFWKFFYVFLLYFITTNL